MNLINLIKEQHAIHGQLVKPKFIFLGILTGFCFCLLIYPSILRFDLRFESQGLKSNNSVPIKYNNISYPYDGNRLAGQCSHSKASTKLDGAAIQPHQQFLDSDSPSNHTNYDFGPTGGQVEKGVWFYANSFGDFIPFTIVDQLASLNINTIYFAGTTISDWKEFKEISNLLRFYLLCLFKGLKCIRCDP